MQSKADLHFHTWHSIDSFISPKDAIKMAIKKDFRVLAITDHDTIEGAKATAKYVKEKNLPIEIIIGEEIYSDGGHVIGLFLQERVPSFQSLEATLTQIKAQGGLAIIPHIMFEEDALGDYLYRYRVSYLDFVKRPDLLEMVDGIEVHNFALIEPMYFEMARFVNEKFLKKAETGSSDCHIKMNFGGAYTLFEGETAEDFRKSIIERTTVPLCVKRKFAILQSLGFGPIIKLPIHLALQFTYRLVIRTYKLGKNMIKRQSIAK